jgi:hypothetical protein
MALSAAQIEDFVRDGFVVVPGAIDAEWCEEQVQIGLRRLGVDEQEPESFRDRRVHMPATQGFSFAEHGPAAGEALAQLLGGRETPHRPSFFDNFIVVLPGEGRPCRSPKDERGGWHKDGDWFLHFLDSPEQAILGIVLWRDVEPSGGGTYFAPDSIGPVARVLIDRPEGLRSEHFDFEAIRAQCADFRELTGSAGDVIWMHPYMLHTGSSNQLERPRILSNPAVSLVEPMRFDRPDDGYSPVERCVLGALGVDRIAYRATSARERIVPDRERDWKRQRKAEKRRLGE